MKKLLLQILLLLQIAPYLSKTCVIPNQFLTCGSCSFYDLHDCFGNCPDSPTNHEIDCAGNCVQKGTGSVIDLCGVCNGNNKLCVDCQNVINGIVFNDNCNICGGNGNGCGLLVQKVFPLAVKNEIGSSFSLVGAGFDSSTRVFLNNAELNNGQVVTVSSQMLTITLSDTYTISQFQDSTNIPIKISNSLKTISNSITLFSSDAMISYLFPFSIYPNEVTSMSVYGNGFINIPGTLCVWDTFPIQTTLVTFKTSNFMICNSPSFPNSGQYSLKILFGGIITTKQELIDLKMRSFISHTAIVLRVKTPAPKVIKSGFIDGSLIEITFNKPIFIKHPTLFVFDEKPVGAFIPTVCSDYFEVVYEGMLWRKGFDDDCVAVFTKGSTIQIRLRSTPSYEPIIQPNDFFYFKRNLFFLSSDFNWAEFLDFPITISSFIDNSKKVGNIQSSLVINGCSDLVFDTSELESLGSRKFAKVFFSYNSNINDISDAKLGALMNILQTQYINGVQILTIWSDLLKPKNFKFTFELNNIFGSLTRSISLQRKIDLNFPQIKIRIPSGQLDYSKYTAIYTEVTRPCSSFADITVNFKWTVKLSQKEITNTELTSSNLILSPFLLLPQQTYVISLEIWYEGYPSSTSEFSITTMPDQVYVSSGGNRQISVKNGLKLTGSYISNSYTDNDFEFQWSCFTDENIPCKDLKSSSGATLVIEKKKDISLQNSLGFGIYTFYLVIKHKTLSFEVSSEPSYITVTADRLPEVALIFSTSIFTSNGFEVYPLIEKNSISVSNSQLSYKYSMSDECNGENYGTLDVFNTSIAQINSGFLKFKPNALSPGSIYCLQLTVKDPNNSLFGAVEREFIIRQSPSSGYCSILYPTTSKEDVKSIYTLSCNSWVSDLKSGQLSFSWEISYSPDEWIVISQFDKSSILSTFLPVGEFSIRVIIMDTVGSKTTYPISTGVIRETVNTKTYFRLNQSSENFEISRNFKQSLNNLAIISLAYQIESISDLKAQFVQSLLDYSISVIYWNILVDRSSTEILLNVWTTIGNEINPTNGETLVYYFSKIMSSLESYFNTGNERVVTSVLQKASELTQILLGKRIISFNQTNFAYIAEIGVIISRVFLSSIVCGESQFDFASSHFAICSGRNSKVYTQKTCNLSISPTSTDKCISFSCGMFRFEKVGLNLPISTKTQILDMNGIFAFLSIPKIDVSFVKQFSLNITLESAFSRRNDISRFSVDNRLACVWSNSTTSKKFEWVNQGCIIAYKDSSIVTCECKKDDGNIDLLIGVAMIVIPPPTPLPILIDNSPDLILMIFIGIILLATLIIVIVKRKNLKSLFQKLWKKIKELFSKKPVKELEKKKSNEDLPSVAIKESEIIDVESVNSEVLHSSKNFAIYPFEEGLNLQGEVAIGVYSFEDHQSSWPIEI